MNTSLNYAGSIYLNIQNNKAYTPNNLVIQSKVF
jgi:hypothetical protein